MANKQFQDFVLENQELANYQGFEVVPVVDPLDSTQTQRFQLGKITDVITSDITTIIYNLTSSDNNKFIQLNEPTPGNTQTINITAANVALMPNGFRCKITQKSDAFFNFNLEAGIVLQYVGNPPTGGNLLQNDIIELIYVGNNLFYGIRHTNLITPSTLNTTNGTITNLTTSSIDLGNQNLNYYSFENITNVTWELGTAGTQPSTTGEIECFRIGNLVCITIYQFAAPLNTTSTDGTITMSGNQIPAAYRPTTNAVRQPSTHIEGSTLVDSSVRLNSSGNIAFFYNPSTSTWPTSTNINIDSCSITFLRRS